MVSVLLACADTVPRDAMLADTVRLAGKATVDAGSSIPPSTPDPASVCGVLVELAHASGLPLSRHVADTLIADPRGHEPVWTRRGCLIELADSTGRTADPIAPLDQWFSANGWRQALPFSADGPDGTMFGYFDRDRLCLFEGHWDGGDDADPAYVPAPGIEFRIRCVRLEPGDTASQPSVPRTSRDPVSSPAGERAAVGVVGAAVDLRTNGSRSSVTKVPNVGFGASSALRSS